MGNRATETELNAVGLEVTPPRRGQDPITKWGFEMITLRPGGVPRDN